MEEERKAGAGGRGRADRRSMPGRWWVPGDVVLVLAVVALSVFLISRGVAGAGAGPHLEVRVTAGGEEVLTRPLHEDSGELKVTGFAGTSYLEISGGRCAWSTPPVPTKLFVKSGWVSSRGRASSVSPTGW